MELQALTKTQGALGDMVETWTKVCDTEADPQVLSGSKMLQMQVHYQNTTHILLTPYRGSQVGLHRYKYGSTYFYPTFINEAGRLVQVFARVVGNG